MTFLQYHNAEKLGWVPFDERPFLQTRLGITTRVTAVRETVGERVHLVARVGVPARYYLWDTFTVEGVEQREEGWWAWGTGWQLCPPALLEGEAFEAFRKACAYFFGFRRIDGLPYCAVLDALADRHRGLPLGEEAERFCTGLINWRPESGDCRYFRAFVREARGDRRGAAGDWAEALRLGTEFAAHVPGGEGR
ncbi:MAG: hypothetical protein K2W96_27765 [Gemmataceae bacterium]|nr:hypothetical protein [Gemmataceae bacterium]